MFNKQTALYNRLIFNQLVLFKNLNIKKNLGLKFKF